MAAAAAKLLYKLCNRTERERAKGGVDDRPRPRPVRAPTAPARTAGRYARTPVGQQCDAMSEKSTPAGGEGGEGAALTALLSRYSLQQSMFAPLSRFGSGERRCPPSAVRACVGGDGTHLRASRSRSGGPSRRSARGSSARTRSRTWSGRRRARGGWRCTRCRRGRLGAGHTSARGTRQSGARWRDARTGGQGGDVLLGWKSGGSNFILNGESG